MFIRCTPLLGFLSVLYLCKPGYAAPAPAKCKPDLTVPAAFRAVDAEMTKMADAQLFAGMAYALKGGTEVLFSKSYGKMFPEWGIDLPKDPRDVRYHIGSVFRLMVAAATWQQYVKGHLDVYASIDKYLNATDFNLTHAWCPRVWNDTAKALQGGCKYPTLVELMSHRSGFIDTGVHCRFDPGSWQAEWCYGGANGTDYSLHVASALAQGTLSPLATLIAIQHVKVPLQNAPNATFQDMCTDDLYLAAVLEKVMGLPMRAIMDANIFKPAGMKKTFYDASSRNDGIYKDYLPLPGYNSFVSPLSLGMWDSDFDYIGNLTVTGGDVGVASRNPEGPPYGTFVKLGRGNLGIDASWLAIAGPAGGPVVTTFRDMGHWMTVLTRKPELLGLNETIVRALFTVGGLNNGLFYGQGVLTYPFGTSTKLPLGTPWAYYIGNLGYAAHQYTEWPMPSDPSHDITVSFVMYTKPVLDAFELDLVSSPTSGGHGSASDPLNPNNGTTTCMLRVKNYSIEACADGGACYHNDFLPQYGVSGDIPPKSESAFNYFWAKHQQAGTPVSKGWVPCPHIYCDASFHPKLIPGLDFYFLDKVASAALGHQMLSPPLK